MSEDLIGRTIYDWISIDGVSQWVAVGVVRGQVFDQHACEFKLLVEDEYGGLRCRSILSLRVKAPAR